MIDALNHFLRHIAGCAVFFEFRIPTRTLSQRQAGFPVPPSSCQPYGVYLYFFKAQSEPLNSFIQVMQKDYTGAAVCVFLQSCLKKGLFLLFPNFRAHEIKVMGQFFDF